jgi:hypothetical protein
MASLTVEQRDEITGLLITMFNAAPGAQALGDVVGAREAGASLENIAAILATKPQFQKVYPSFLSTQEFADRVVAELLPSTTPEGAKTWAINWIIDMIESGESTATVLLQASQALATTENPEYADAQALLHNRIEVANHYSVVREQPTSDLVLLQDLIADVTTDPASVAAAKEAIDQNLDGLSFTLTPGADVFAGSTGDDKFRALSVDGSGTPHDTFTSFDKLNGGAGTDTLDLYVSGSFNAAFPASATVQNVEIINIHTNGAAFAPINAAQFQGATWINQKGLASAVTNLAATTTAGFVELGGELSVTAADAAPSLAVHLTNVADTATLNLKAGANGTLNTVKITGSVVDVASDGAVEAIATTVTAGKDVTTVMVNSAVAIDLAVADGSGKAVNTVDASGSTGAIHYDYEAGTTISKLTTGSGADRVTLTDGIDSVASTARIDGGAGNDMLITAGKTLIAADYVLLNEVMVGFEGITFTTNAATVAANRMANFTHLAFTDAAGTVTGVGAEQKVFASVDLNATALGYKAGGTYAGALDISAAPLTAGNILEVVANADTLQLTVGAGNSNGNGAADLGGVILKGDAKSAAVTLASTADGAAKEVAGVQLDTSTDHAKMESFTVSGNGMAKVINAANAELSTIDASGLANAQPDGALGQGLLLDSSNMKAELVKLSAAKDQVSLLDSTFGAMDTVDGLDLAADTLTVAAAGFKHVDIAAGSLNLALTQAASSSAGDALVFHFDGNTYIYGDSDANNRLDDTDLLVKVVGDVNLDQLVATLG